MASFILSMSLPVLLFALIALFSRISISEAKTVFSFANFGKNASFEPDDIAMFGNAKIVDGGSSISIQLNNSVSLGGGRVVYKKPIEFMDTKSWYAVGFTTSFSFSIPPNRGGRLGFVVFPVNGTFDHSLFEIKFDTSEIFNNVTVIVNGSTVSEKLQNFTNARLEKEEKKLVYVWINYQASGQFAEVRLSKSASFNPVDCVISDRINLAGVLKDDDEFMVGVKSYSGNFNLHSWGLETRGIPRSMHSYVPFMLEQLRKEEEAKRKRRERMWEIATCFVMTFGSTGLVFFAAMHIWAAFKRNSLVMAMQEECGIKTKEFEYEKMEKMEVVMSKDDVKQEKK